MTDAAKPPEKSAAEQRAELAGDLDMLRTRGVAKFVDVKAGLTIEFFPPQPDVSTTKEAPSAKSVCKCGHYLYEHNDAGLCIAHGGGCDPEKCAGPEKA